MSHDTSFRLVALALLLGILSASALLWPIPDLGFDVEPQTGVVQTVRPGSAAAQTGLQPGDRIASIYGYPWEAVNRRLFLLPLPWPSGMPTPVTVVSDGQVRELVMDAGAPALWLQIDKALRLIMALICWCTGYLLGTSPRAASQRLRWVGWFWVLLGGSLGLYQLTHLTSYVLTIGVLWVQCTVLAPTAVALHSWYPSRPTSPTTQRRTWRLLLATLLATNLGALALAFLSSSASALSRRLEAIGLILFLMSVGLSIVILWRAYRATVVAHIRRQIRLIGAACLLAGCWWALLLLLRWANPVARGFLPPAVASFGTVLIPLAYLLGGISADLMRLDQLVRRALVHTLTVFAILAILIVGAQSQALVVTPALVVLVILALYGPLYHWFKQLFVAASGPPGGYAALRKTTMLLGTSLQAEELLRFLAEGIQGTFQNPTLAVYHRADQSASALACRFAHQLDTPPSINTALLEALPVGESTVLPVSKVQQQLGQQPLDAATAGLIFHPAVSLWGVIRHQRGDILSLVLLGPRGDDDPYQAQDVTELEQVLSAAALALTNSASYEEQVAARTMIRQLYQHAQQIEEQTAAEIAQEIHDEVLNVNLRLNIELLQGLLAEARDPWLKEQLQLVLDGEQTMSQMLRLICEQLKPSGFDHPLGLAASLRQQTDRVRASWLGQVALEIENTAVPVEEHIHRALVRIAREALTNAVKHAAATAIIVRLRFPDKLTEALALTVCDNGQGSQQPITPRPGHWGVRNMQEYAEAIGATISWSHPPAGGTYVEVTVPAAALRTEATEASAKGTPFLTALNGTMGAPPASPQEA